MGGWRALTGVTSTSPIPIPRPPYACIAATPPHPPHRRTNTPTSILSSSHPPATHAGDPSPPSPSTHTTVTYLATTGLRVLQSLHPPGQSHDVQKAAPWAVGATQAWV